MVDLTKPKLSIGWVLGAVVAVIILAVIVWPIAGMASKFLSNGVSKLTGGKLVLPVIGA